MRTKLLFLIITFSALYSCNEGTGYKKIGDAKVSYSNGELLVDNFPRYSMGVTGFNQRDFGSFSFDQLDEYVYEVAIKESEGTSYPTNIYISIRYIDEDRYGNIENGSIITIGLINLYDTKQFTDFEHWHRYNKTYQMWLKDYSDHKKQSEEESRGKLYSVGRAYEPKSLR